MKLFKQFKWTPLGMTLSFSGTGKSLISNILTLSVTVVLLAMMGCAPGLDKPADSSPNVPVRFDGGLANDTSDIPAQWWFAFQDDELNQLIKITLAENPNMGIVYSRLTAARANVNAINALSQPRLDGTAGVGYSESSRTTPLGSLLNGLPGQPSIKGRQFTLGALASWEPDFWHRVLNAKEAAQTKTVIAESDIHSYKLILISEVITFYWQARSAEADFHLQSTLKQTKTNRIKLLTAKSDGGLINEYEITKVKQELARIDIDINDALKRRELNIHSLATLVGKPISEFSVEWRPAGADLPQRPVLSPGIPASILSRRPDLIELEQSVRATRAMRNIARSAFYPSIRLTSAYGFASKDLDELLKKDSREVAVGPVAISIPIFDGGKNRANLVAADASYNEAVAAYKSKLLLDLKEVDDSLTELKSTENQLHILEDALIAAKRGETIKRARADGGLTNYVEVASAIEDVTHLQRDILRTKEKLIVETVVLIRALGGAPDVE